MESFSSLALAVLAIVVFNNYRTGTLGDWLGAKFFNRGDPDPVAAGDVAQTDFGGGLPLTRLAVEVGNGGALSQPVIGTIPQGGRFGDRRSLGRRHAGVDFSAPTGTPVVSAGAGRVTYAGAAGGYGLRVDVDHGGGLTTRYAHLSRIAVRLGQRVERATTLGSVGSTGSSTGPHLHFEVRRNGVAVDPMRELSGAARAVVA